MELNFTVSEVPEILKINKKTGELAVGIRIPKSKYFDDPVKFLDKSDRLQVTDETNISDQIEISQRLYHSEDIVGASIDRMVEFATTGITIEETGKKPLDTIFRYFARSLNANINLTSTGLKSFVKQFLQEHLISGNVFPYEYWKIVDGVKDEQASVGRFTMPISILTINPLRVKIDTAALEMGIEKISVLLDDATTKYLIKDGRIFPEIMPFKKLLKKSQIRKFKQGKPYGKDIKVDINPRLISHVKRKTPHYRVWGIPFLSRAFDALSQIHQLREMDRSIIDGMINNIVLFKLGDKDFPATQRRINSFKSLFSQAKKQELIVWPHDISHELIEPDSKVLQYKDKYKESYDRLFIALGVPPILLGQEYRGDAEVAISAFAETLRDLQEVIIEYVEYVLKKIADNNGYQNIYPKVRMETVNVNKLRQWTALRDAYLTGIIAKKQYNEGLGFNYWETIELKKQEQEDEVDELFMPPSQPFQGEQTDKGGRPPESTDQDTEDEKITQLKKREKQAASIYEERLGACVDRLKESDKKEDIDYAMMLLSDEVRKMGKAEGQNVMSKFEYLKEDFGFKDKETIIREILELF